jgi:hypothetical protein
LSCNVAAAAATPAQQLLLLPPSLLVLLLLHNVNACTCDKLNFFLHQLLRPSARPWMA